MDFGVLILPHILDSWRDVEVAEANGFTHAWFADSHMIYSDVFVSMALAAERTRRIKLATGVVIAKNRIAPVIAHSIATINRLAPGRVILGLGTGHTARRVMGMPAASLQELRDTVEVCRALLDGKETEYREGSRRRLIKFLHYDEGYINVDDYIPIHLAASHPRALAMTGELADGLITFSVNDPGTLESYWGYVREGAARAGRSLQHFPVSSFVAAAVLRPGETGDTPRVQELVGYWSLMTLHYLYEVFRDAKDVPPALQNVFPAYQAEINKLPPERRHQVMHEGHALYFKRDEERFLTREGIAATNLVGTPDELVERIKKLEAAGLTQIVLAFPLGRGRQSIEEFARKVMARC